MDSELFAKVWNPKQLVENTFFGKLAKTRRKFRRVFYQETRAAMTQNTSSVGIVSREQTPEATV